MTSPYSSGGGGVQFETRVAAYYLAALLGELPARGIACERIVSVKAQRADLGAPLDDLIIAAERSDGSPVGLHLQVKNQIAFTAKDADWIDVVQRAWDTFSEDGFGGKSTHLGIAIGRYSTKADDDYQSVLQWARYSDSADDYFRRIEKKDFSSDAKIKFVSDIRSIIDAHVGAAVADVELWSFLKCFVVLHFDFQNGEASRDTQTTVDRLQRLTIDAARSQASHLWDHLVARAGELIPLAGSITCGGLRKLASDAGFPLQASSLSNARELEALDRESKLALAQIKSDIAGLRLHRRAAVANVRSALGEARFIQIVGEPGTGKSAILKEFAEDAANIGPVFVLKDSRIHPKGWSAHAHILGISNDCVQLLIDLSSSGESILFIDGIDKISDPAVQITVNDVLRAIAFNANLLQWRVLVTVREQNLTHLETWLDGDALKALPMATVTVGVLEQQELDTLGDTFPQLRPLISEKGVDVILRRPFFVSALLTLGARSGSSTLPATEVALLKLWWELGGTDQPDFALAQARRETLIALAERQAKAQNSSLPISGLDVDALQALKSAGVIRAVELGHTAVFAHDIYEEWASCELLIRKKSDIAKFLLDVGEPQILLRPIQLLGVYELETGPTVEPWKRLIAGVSDATLRPVWQRAVLTSPLQSTRATSLLAELSEYLFANEAEKLRKLMLALRTVEVIPNPWFLDERLSPDVELSNRAKYANLTAKPRIRPWIRFLDWLVPKISLVPPAAIPDLLPILATWQEAFPGDNVRWYREIGQFAGLWLRQVEQDFHPEKFSDRKRPFGDEVSYDDEGAIEKKLRSLFLASSAQNGPLVAAYLAEKTADQGRANLYCDAIMESCADLALHLPDALVTFILANFLEGPEDAENDTWGGVTQSLIDGLGIRDHNTFYPASPVQPPFLILLRRHEQIGLRLIRELCNHSISVWRWGRAQPGHYAPTTPIPLSLTFPWGEQTFWGDQQVYSWFRGTWGNDAVRSALMALELWALQQVDAGAEFSEVFEKVVSGNDSVAVLGLGVSLCLAFPEKAIRSAVPLVTCPHLWGWDIKRWMDDRGLPPNQIGDWHRHKTQMSAVKTLNERPHRKEEIRQLLPRILFGGDDALQKAALAGVASFVERLPFEYEEEKQSPEHVADIEKKMSVFAEWGVLTNWRVQETENGGFYIWCDLPSSHTEEFKEQSEDHFRLQEYLALSLWAQKTLDESTLQPSITLDDAWSRARAIDGNDTFQLNPADDDFRARNRASGVAGVAFVLTKYAPDGEPGNEQRQWALSVLRRVIEAADEQMQFPVRSAILSMNPKVFAVHGFASLLAKDVAASECRQALLLSSLHPLEAIASAVYSSMAVYATKQHLFCWVLFDLGLRQCIVDRGDIPDYRSLTWSSAERAHKERLLRRANSYLAKNKLPTLPAIPMPWIKPTFFSSLRERFEEVAYVFSKKERRRHADPSKIGYRRNQLIFVWNLAEKIIFKAPIQLFMGTTADVRRVVDLASDLRDFTAMELLPPYAKSPRENRGNIPYEWVGACSFWLGRVAALLDGENVKKEIILPILKLENETALQMMSYVLRAFLFNGIRKQTIAGENLSLWTEMANWVLVNREGTYPLQDHLDREYTSCVFPLLFCVQADFSPLQCVIEPSWPPLASFRDIVERVVTGLGVNSTIFISVAAFFNGGGKDFLPEPGLNWMEKIVIARKADLEFWQQNGEDMVSILKAAISPSLTEPQRRKIIWIADTLVDSGVRGAGFLQQELVRGVN